MTKLPKKMASEIVIDRGLDAETRRVFAAGRQLTEVVEFDEEHAIDLARRIAAQLSNLPPDVRLANWRKFVSFLVDLHALTDRLDVEKNEVERRLMTRARQRAGGRAYHNSGVRK